jgi:hypothetical protein
MHEARDGPNHVANMWAHVVSPLLCLIAFPVDFFSQPQDLEKMMWQKRLGPFMSGRSLKVKNMQKQENLLRSVKKQMKGDHLENP